MKTKIHHITWENALPHIVNDGIVKLEGSNLEELIKSGEHVGRPDQQEKSFIWKVMKKQMKHTGRYVWFTEDSTVNCIGDSEEMGLKKVGIPFYAEDIGAKKWCDVKKTIYNKRGRKIIKKTDSYATQIGDDITKWWVVDTEVPLSKKTDDNYFRINEY